MVVGKRTFEGEILSGNSLDLLLFVFVLLFFCIILFGNVIDDRPLCAIKTIRTERKGSWWGCKSKPTVGITHSVKIIAKELKNKKSCEFENFLQTKATLASFRIRLSPSLIFLTTHGVETKLEVASLNRALSTRPLLNLTTDRQWIDGLGIFVVQSRRWTGNE